MVRVGIIGVGGMGTFHARTLATLADVEVVAVSDPSEANTTVVRDELGATVVDDPFDMIAGSSIDGLVVASPDDTHAGFAVAAVRRGLPILCEKPLATTAVEAWPVVEAEVACGRRLVQLGFMREYDAAHRQVRDELDASSDADIEFVRALHRNANPVRRPLGEIVGQSMVHDIHTVRHLTGAEIVWVRASGSGASDGSFRHVIALCGLSTGAHVTIEFDDGGFAYEVGVEVLTTGGDVLTGAPTRAIRRADGSIDVHLGSDWFGWFAEAYRLQDQAWVDALRTGDATGPSAWDGYAAQTVVDAILASLGSGRTVEVTTADRPPLYA